MPKEKSKVKKGRGRPSRMTDEVLRKLEQGFSAGMTDQEACYYAGIGIRTMYDWQEADPDFSHKKEEWKSRMALNARLSFAFYMTPKTWEEEKKYKDPKKRDDKALIHPPLSAVQWFLERKMKDEFSSKTVTETVGGEEKPMPNQDVQKLLDDFSKKMKKGINSKAPWKKSAKTKKKTGKKQKSG